MDAKILINMGYCTVCNQVLLSLHRHDFRSCEGDHGFVDGGLAYFRYGGNIVPLGIVLNNGKIEFEDERISSALARLTSRGGVDPSVGG